MVLATGAFLVGCGNSGAAPTAKVSGKVTVDGMPVSGAVVSFNPVSGGSSKGGRMANATTGSDGTYKLSSFAKEDGAMPGDYTVSVIGMGVPMKYNDGSLPEMKKKVDSGKANVIDLPLTN